MTARDPSQNARMRLVTLLILMSLPSAAYARSILPAWFWGTWNAGSCDDTKTLCMTRDYTFTPDGHFTISGYPPLQQSGRYHVTDMTKTETTLALTGQKGDFGSTDSTLTLEPSSNPDQMRINGDGPYVKKENSSPKPQQAP